MAEGPKFTSEVFYNRLLQFGIDCQKLVRQLPKGISNFEYSKQLIRSSASPRANYIEAIEASSRKDFIHRLKICRKEAKESIHWLKLIQSSNEKDRELIEKCAIYIKEALEFIRIFTSSILTAEKNGAIDKFPNRK
jgi:four helix bundle protein